MARRLDIGIASWNNPDKLNMTIQTIRETCRTDFRLLVADNNSTDPRAREVAAMHAARDKRVIPVNLGSNTGYAGAVNAILQWAETEYICYSDNDMEYLTSGWDEVMCGYLDRYHEIGMVFPGGTGASYPIPRGPYVEVQWGTGCAWILNRMTYSDTGLFDAEIGHQNECDYCLRVRMAGWKCAVVGEVQARHHATASNDPAAIERINRGVVQFVNKWVAYFCGKQFNYHSPNVLRWEDWPPNALYMEEYWKARLPVLNDNPEVVNLEGREYDLIRCPRLMNFYRGRII